MQLNVEFEASTRSATLKIGTTAVSVVRDLFVDPASDADKRKLFKTCVKRVNIELSSYCNRRCGFCPNKEGTRLKAHHILPRSIFESVIANLEVINYRAGLYFHLYNEPLADPDLLIERASHARSRLPDAKFGLNSNGDYLTQELLTRLDGAGINDIFVSVYGPNQGDWVEDYVRERVVDIAARIGLKTTLNEKPGMQYSISGRVGNVAINVAARNLWKSGYDRGMLIPELSVTRTSPCVSPITDVSIDYRGYMLPCCNVYTDNPSHIPNTFANLSDVQIFDAYANSRAQSWRRDLLQFDPPGSFCRNCSRSNHQSLDTPANRETLMHLRRNMQLAD